MNPWLMEKIHLAPYLKSTRKITEEEKIGNVVSKFCPEASSRGGAGGITHPSSPYTTPLPRRFVDKYLKTT
jgi:hypothetical protein